MQGEPKGIAHAIGLCEQHIQNEPSIIYLGDNLTKGGIKEDFTNTFKPSNHEAMILLCKVETSNALKSQNSTKKTSALVGKSIPSDN